MRASNEGIPQRVPRILRLLTADTMAADSTMTADSTMYTLALMCGCCSRPCSSRASCFINNTINSILLLLMLKETKKVYYCTITINNVVVVDPHIQRIVLATGEVTMTQRVSHRPIQCQSRSWSQRGTKVNGSHHGDNPLPMRHPYPGSSTV